MSRDAAPRKQTVAAAEHVVQAPGQPLPNARRFIESEYGHPNRHLLVHQGGVFYRWEGVAWPEIDDGELRTGLYNFFDDKVYLYETKDSAEYRPFAPNRYKVADLVDALRAVAHIPVETKTPAWFDSGELPADECIACQNGLVHWPTRTLYEHTPDFYSHHAVSFDFDLMARPKRWLEFLEEIWGDDQESINTLQEEFGYMISGDTSLQKMFLHVGPRRSGKGTIARILRATMGAHNVAGPTLAGLGTNFGLAPLIGKPVAIIADARLKQSDTSIVTERLLSISGEDTLTIDRKYKEPWTGQLGARFLVLSNELPRLSDSSGALASRFIVLTMERSFYGKENPELTRELCMELPGIFNWALDGLERLRARGYFVQPEASKHAVLEMEDLSSPISAFLRDHCNIGPEHQVRCDTLYAAWRRWCEDHGHLPGSSNIFGRNLRSAVPSMRTIRPQDGGSRQRTYQYIGLKCGHCGPKPNSCGPERAK